MDCLTAMEQRYSYRGAFRDEPVSREDLVRIVTAGLQAPSGKNLQTTGFVIVDDAAILRPIAALHPMAAMQTARAMIVCVIDTPSSAPVAVNTGTYELEDCAAAVENMLLAITALGYASVWIQGGLRAPDRAAQLARLIGLPEMKMPLVLLPVGKPAEEGPRQDKRLFGERAWFNRYGGGA